MMLNVVLYDEKSVINIAKKAMEYLSKQELFRTTRDTIWVNGLYIKFSSDLLIVNAFNSNIYSKKKLYECLYYILDGEEVFVSDERQINKYIEKVNRSTEFDSFFELKGV